MASEVEKLLAGLRKDAEDAASDDAAAAMEAAADALEEAITRDAAAKPEGVEAVLHHMHRTRHEAVALLDALPDAKPEGGGDRYDAWLGVYDEASLRAAEKAWLAMEYESNARDDWQPGEHARLNRMQVALERAIAAHDHFIDSEDNYLPVATAPPSSTAPDSELRRAWNAGRTMQRALMTAQPESSTAPEAVQLASVALTTAGIAHYISANGDLCITAQPAVQGEREAALVKGLTLARNRIQRLALECPQGSTIHVNALEWAGEATDALDAAGNGGDRG